MPPFFETRSQAWVFLGTVYIGLALGIVYDALGIVRASGKKGWVFAADLLFFLLAGAALTLALVMTGQDGLRLYALLGLACGGVIYLMGLRRLFTALAALWRRLVVEPMRAAGALRKARREAGNRRGAANTKDYQ